MFTNKTVLSVSCIVMLVLIGCSRQQSDWQKTRETNTTDAYEQFLKKYPKGEFTAQAQARAKELYEEKDWQKARDADTPEAYQAFLKQYPDGKWTEEARIRVENFTLAQAPGAATGTTAGAAATAAANPRRSADESPPAPHVKPAPAAKSAAAPAAARTAAGAFRIQLGAFSAGSGAADKHWAYLQKQYPDLMSGLSSKVVPLKTESGNLLYRLQATGLSEKRAREICDGLKAKSQACVLVPPIAG